MTVTALDRAFGADPIPPIAILCGGTMNVVATSLKIRERPAVFLQAIVEATRNGQSLESMRRRCLRIGAKVGFLFGSGLPANFLAEYYGPGEYGPARAAWLLVRAFFSALWQGPFIRKLFKRFEGSVRVDGKLLEQTAFVGLMAGTVREVGLGFKLVHRADDDPERFGVLAMHSAVLSLTLDIWAVQHGRGIAPSRAFSAVASQMDVHSKNGSMAYTIDGDLYRTQDPVAISLGPPIVFLKPPSALIVRPRGDTMGGQ
jgi:diacylglycerol kinase family enzyme